MTPTMAKKKAKRTVRKPKLKHPMVRIDVPMPEPMKRAAEMVSDDAGHSTVAEYVRHLLRRDLAERGISIERRYPKVG
jgi:hypothetical protein